MIVSPMESAPEVGKDGIKIMILHLVPRFNFFFHAKNIVPTENMNREGNDKAKRS